MTNLQDSLKKELLFANVSGAYCATTLTGCNIRKYHGLFVVPIPEIDDEHYVLLSALDETIIQHGAAFNLGLHQYAGGHFSPKGHKYILSFEWEDIPTWIYRIGGVLLKKEIIFRGLQKRLFIRYTLLDAHSETTLRLKPYLAFRSVRAWTHENGTANTAFTPCENGIAMCLYPRYPQLYMQTDCPCTYHHAPDWYRNFEYIKEKERGYEELEDLLVPGYFELTLRKGQSVIFTASLRERNPKTFEHIIAEERSNYIKRDSLYHCLVDAALQFKVEQDGETYLLAGHPWFKARARDTFIAMPGLTLSIGETRHYEAYMNTAAKALEDFMEGRDISVRISEVEQPDILLWAIWCIQMYAHYEGIKACARRYGKLCHKMLDYIRMGRHSNLFLHDNGLLYSNGREKAVTWMNAMCDDRPITPRSGYIVEFNALWYNAVCFSAALHRCEGTKQAIAMAERSEQEAAQIAQSFREVFLNEKGYLYDYVDGSTQEISVRPNQLMAIALPYSPLDNRLSKGVLDVCTRELATPKGIRSLSPKNGAYNPRYIGRQEERDKAYHQGTAWPWLMAFYLEAYKRIYKMSGINYIERQLVGLEEELFYHCVGTIPEVFDGNPPFSGRGAMSFAMNVGGILRTLRLTERPISNP